MGEQSLTVVRDTPAPTMTGGLVPSNLADAMKFAEIMCKGRLVPQHLQESIADCLMVVEQAARWRLSPFAVAQCTSVIQGKLMFEGKLVAAVVNARGELVEKLQYRFSGEGERLICFPWARLKGEDKPREIPEGVELVKVRTNNDMWRKQPHQQLTYAAARIWARRHMPELMLGVYTPEEDIEPAEPRLDPSSARALITELDNPKASAAPATHGAEGAANSTVVPPDAEADFDGPGMDTGDHVECWIWKRSDRGQNNGEWRSTGMHPKLTDAQNRHIHVLLRDGGYADADYRKVLRNYNKESTSQLSVAEAGDIIDRLRKKGARATEATTDLAADLAEPGSEG